MEKRKIRHLLGHKSLISYFIWEDACLAVKHVLFQLKTCTRMHSSPLHFWGSQTINAPSTSLDSLGSRLNQNALESLGVP